MTEQISKPHKRLATTLGIAIAAALSPSGKIISSAVAAGFVAVAVTGYAIHEHKPPRHDIHASIAAAEVSDYLAGTLPLVYTTIEADDGHEIHIQLTAGANANSSNGSAPSLWVTGWPIGGAGNPSKSFQRVGGPTFGAASPHLNAQDSSSPQPDIPPHSILIVEIDCLKEENKLNTVCATKAEKSEAEMAKTEAKAEKSEAEMAKTGAKAEKSDAETAKTETKEAKSEAEAAKVEAKKAKSGDDAPDYSLVNFELLKEFLTVKVPPESENTGLNSGKKNEQTMRRSIIQDEDEPIQAADSKPTSVPEPSLISLMLLGVAAMAWTGRRRTAPPKQTRV